MFSVRLVSDIQVQEEQHKSIRCLIAVDILSIELYRREQGMDYEKKSLAELKEIAKEKGIKKISS